MSEDKPIITIDPIIRGKIATDYLMQTANPAIPVTFVRQNIMSGKPKFIIIHDSSCLNHSNSALLIDGPASAIGALKVENIVKSNYNDYKNLLTCEISISLARKSPGQLMSFFVMSLWKSIMPEGSLPILKDFIRGARHLYARIL